MNTLKKEDLQPSREQIIYANLLIIGVLAGLIILVTTYAIYVSGILPALSKYLSFPRSGVRVSVNIWKLPIHPMGGGVPFAGQWGLSQLHWFCAACSDDHFLLPGFGQGICSTKKLDIYGYRCPGNQRTPYLVFPSYNNRFLMFKPRL